MSKKAIVLLSGGQDSTTCLAVAKDMGFSCYALSIDYGQRHKVELEAAKKIASSYKVEEHWIIPLDFSKITSSALTNKNIEIPTEINSDIPVTYVPARNTIFLSFALGWAEVIQAFDIFIGISQVDYSGYPDCRPEFINSFGEMANLATKEAVLGNKITIHTPLLYLSKQETVELGIKLGVDYGQTITCYQADHEGKACGVCPSCILRAKGFKDANVLDPTIYKNN